MNAENADIDETAKIAMSSSLQSLPTLLRSP